MILLDFPRLVFISEICRTLEIGIGQGARTKVRRKKTASAKNPKNEGIDGHGKFQILMKMYLLNKMVIFHCHVSLPGLYFFCSASFLSCVCFILLQSSVSNVFFF